ncbi:hypothetical protein K432DRAFT_433854 [Lepidopterella palustris CBS 459.81]|uniref:NAD(P)-binding domain-containing protein n=1 Tax=Lepidopterella palustris CBS 459.81 TaxID=1314670 RepID=A0A8E2EDM8_9PEZI|nr:hypothetical protein K432DRAFT_433854 [Lepidopterella palustris CBS 459.81]
MVWSTACLAVPITGAAGHLGFRTLIMSHQAGYRVRAAVRSQAKADTLLAIHVLKSLNLSSQLSFIVVPNLTIMRVYYEAVKGARYVLHIASPIAHRTLTHQKTQGTVGILESAYPKNSISRIVMITSIAAILEISNFNSFFDIVHIDPSIIIGRNDLIAKGKDVVSGTIAVVLKPKILAESYLISYNPEGVFGGTVWQDATYIVAIAFPDAAPTLPLKFNSRGTEVFGFKHQNYEEQVESVVGHCLHFVAKE